jgi:hypothetical protein
MKVSGLPYSLEQGFDFVVNALENVSTVCCSSSLVNALTSTAVASSSDLTVAVSSSDLTVGAPSDPTVAV